MRLSHALAAILCLSFIRPSALDAQSRPIMLGIGDSLGEGVQSADANTQTQPNSYLSVLASLLRVPFQLPLISSGSLGVVGNTSGRARIDPGLAAANLSVSGARVSDLLFQRADSTIDSEADLVLAPRLGLSQIEIATSLGSPFVVCWIGSNDALSAVTSFDQLDASQLTPVAAFAQDFHDVVSRLVNAGSFVALANVPDVTDIAYLMNRDDLRRFLGSDYGLPDGDWTTLPAMMLVKLGLADGSIFSDPNYVLDSTEIATIHDRIVAYNQVIADTAAEFHMPVADVFGWFKALADAEPTVFGVRITARYLGGLFSLDGVHPSNFGHAIVATAFMASLSSYFHLTLPVLSLDDWTRIFTTDPFIDKDGDGRVAGRPGAGLLETLGPLLGVSGDTNDALPSAAGTTDTAAAADMLLQSVDASPALRQRGADRAARRRAAVMALHRLFRTR
jgi:lysophospholipase L1-like esterase